MQITGHSKQPDYPDNIMQLLPTPTILDQGVIAGAEAAHHLASVLHSQWPAFWSRSPEVILSELNADPSRSATIFGLNSQAASAVNALLDAITDGDTESALRFPTRAPNSMPDGWSFGASGFVYTAPEPPAEILP